jgi:hypothetical protein
MPDFHRSIEMTISREEFERFLPAAIGTFDVVHTTGPSAQISWHARPCGSIRLLPLPDRRLGGATVPRHLVEITLAACSDADGEAFMDRFHRAFLRGGG